MHHELGRVMAKEQLFISKVKDIYRLNGIRGHLGWDQETIMPKGGAASRSDILSWLGSRSSQENDRS